MFKDKGLIFGILATVVLIAGGVFLMTKGQNSSPVSSSKVSTTLLIPNGVYETSGIVNDQYLPATPSAKITLVEFGDYQCPACGAYSSLVKQALVDFAGKLNYVFHDMAFVGPESVKAAEATYCAGDQNKYWEYHDYLYAHQNGENRGAFSDDNLKGFGQSIGLDATSFGKCLDSDKYKSKVSDLTNDGSSLGVNSNPTFFLNDSKIENLPANYTDFKALISDTLSK